MTADDGAEAAPDAGAEGDARGEDGDDAADFWAEAETAGGGTDGDSPTEDGGPSEGDDTRGKDDYTRVGGDDITRAEGDDTRGEDDDMGAGGDDTRAENDDMEAGDDSRGEGDDSRAEGDDMEAEDDTRAGGDDDTRAEDDDTRAGGDDMEAEDEAGAEGDDSRVEDDDTRAGDDEATAEESISDDEGGWTRLRRLRVALGGGAFAVGLALAVGGTVLALPSLSGLAGPAGRALVVVLGVVAVLQGLWAAFRARSASPDLADPPDPEPVGGDRPPVAGGAFDDAVERLADPGAPDGEARETVRRDLRRTAVTLLAEQTGCSRAEAATRITEGDWTDDPRAAAFLGGPDAARVPLETRVREWLAPGTPAGQRARRAAGEVVALAEEGR